MGVPYSQVVPKGGWWLHVLREVTEHELRMVAAVIGLTYDRVLSPTEASWEVKTGAMPRVAFIRLGSIAAYIFASMAVRERGPGGRARPSNLLLLQLAREPRRFGFCAVVRSAKSENMVRGRPQGAKILFLTHTMTHENSSPCTVPMHSFQTLLL